MNSGTGKSVCVVYYVQLLNRAGLKNNDGYPIYIKAEDWFCV